MPETVVFLATFTVPKIAPSHYILHNYNFSHVHNIISIIHLLSNCQLQTKLLTWSCSWYS